MADNGKAENDARLTPLENLDDCKVAEGDPDVRGWDVTGADGERVGRVNDLVVDTAAMRVRYLDVTLDERAGGSGDRHVLIPIGGARLDDADDAVRLDYLDAAQLSAFPSYTPGPPMSERGASPLGGDSDTHLDDSRLYAARRERDHPAATQPAGDEQRMTLSEEELAVGKRTRQAGEVEIRKAVAAEHVRQPVIERRDDVTIERRPVDGMSTGQVDIGEDEIRIPIIEEELVVEKRPVVREEIVIRKHAGTEEKIVEADLRKERVDVDRNVRGAHDERPEGQ